MTRKLKIIHLENDNFSASLIHSLLFDEGVVSDIVRVETEQDFRLLLEQGEFDLVLSDLNMPAFSGRTALVMTRKKYPDLPFIFVTGTMGEEVAIESLKSGATDFVLKSRLSRLIPSVRRALREVEELKNCRRVETAQLETEKKILESQLHHSQKMESIGTLAAGIAHDFNNILTVIVGYTNVVTMKLPKDDPLRTDLSKVLTAADRAAALTKSLLAYSRKGDIDLHPVELNKIFTRVDHLLTRIIGEDISLKVMPTYSDLTLLADEGQIEQILMNLASNARDAMQNGGDLLIEAKRTTIDAGFINIHGFGREGDYALISVSDNGTGMDKATQGRIFEPFFTTKEVGKGTGLGLSIVYGIVTQHNGFIYVYSEPGKGTTFRIYLPLINSGPENRCHIEEFPVRGEGETILLVEDSKEISSVLSAILNDFGYRVINAADGEKGVEKFISHKDEVDLLLLDVIMPCKNGRETLEEIRTIKPNVKALFMSGYAVDIISFKGIDTCGFELLSKPFSPFTLLAKVRNILDR